MSNPHINTTDDRFTNWWKSSRSGPNESCLYTASSGALVAVANDTDGVDGPIRVFNRTAWASFVDAVKAGHLHR